MNQAALFHEDVYEALRTDIMAAGGMKKVGHALRPKLSVNAAGEWLSSTLNRSRAEKLDPEDVLFIKAMARAAGSLAAVAYDSSHLNLTMPTPIEPEDERAQLQREFNKSVSDLGQLAARIERLSK